jgi:hypothetical protein
MGFGTLFIGYFLLLNIFNYAYTDLISALIMMFAAYKLSTVGKDFKNAYYVLIPYAALGAYELLAEFLSMFSPALNNQMLTGIIGVARYALLGVLNFFILSGIKKLAIEVELPRLKEKSGTSLITLTIAYSVALILEIPFLDKLIPTKALAVTALLSLLFTFAVTIYSLTAIYSAYMRICMPEDLIQEEKTSKFATVNKFRENEKKRGEEYANYKVEKLNGQNKKKGRK